MIKEDVRVWHLDATENVSVGDFNNVTDKTLAVFPGQKAGDSIFAVKNSDDAPIKEVYDEAKYKYSYFGKGYFYGIKNDNTEQIAIVTEQNELISVFAGAGNYKFKSSKGEVLFEGKSVKSFEATEIDGYTAITACYNAEGNFGLVRKNQNTYIFKENCITAVCSLECLDIADGLWGAYLVRSHISESNSFTKRVALDWVYPENNDNVYKEVDALVISERFSNYTVTTAFRDKNSSHKFHINSIGPNNYSLNIPRNTKNVDYSCNFDIAFMKADERDGYVGLFKTRNMDFAAGVAAVDETDNSTMFVGKKLRLNLNVTNIWDTDINFSAKYNIFDYQGKIVSSGTFYTNPLSVGEDANHLLDIEFESYGMHYLNLYVATKDNEYRECYPFAILEDFPFKYRKENPFGICATHTETIGEGRSTASIVKKMGLSIVRLGESYDQRHFINTLKEYGIDRYIFGFGWCDKEEKVDAFVDTVKKHFDNYPDGAYTVMANEVDSPHKANYDKSKKFLEEVFVPYTFNPAYKCISENYPEQLKKMVWQSNCHGTTEWLEAFHETGLWDKSEFIDIHSYSSPSGPDKVFSNQMVSMYANTFSNEYAAVRWKRLIRRYGPKRLVITETGYPTSTPAGDTKEIDIRTGADFNLRIALFFLEAGCEDLLYYCLYDRTGALIGTSEWNEMYFGAMYSYDYNGVYMPKPWAAAFANLTRRFDGYKSCRFFDKYEEDEWGTLRAFEVETEDNNFAVVWSNIYMQPNTTAEGRVNNVERDPMPAWEDRWIKKETREFDAVGSTVEVIDIMGNKTVYEVTNGKVAIEVSGSPLFIYGIF